MGRALWTFIDDPETTSIYRILMARVRSRQATVALPFRCDSPQLRRFMRLEIVRMPKGQLDFQCRIVRLEVREEVRLLDPAAERSQEFLSMCSWCKKVRMPDGRWWEVEEAVERLNLFHAARLPQISHGICDDCCASFDVSKGLGLEQ